MAARYSAHEVNVSAHLAWHDATEGTVLERPCAQPTLHLDSVYSGSGGNVPTPTVKRCKAVHAYLRLAGRPLRCELRSDHAGVHSNSFAARTWDSAR